MTRLIIGGAVVAMVVGFLLFRPDKLFVDDRVEESLEEAFAAPATTTTIPPPASPATPAGPETTPPPAETTVPPTTSPPVTTPDTTVAVGPTVVATGGFFGIDHRAAGTATIYEQDGRYVLRFEDDTDIQNGPDLFVWVTTDTNWDDPGRHIDLGKLKGNIGGQNYELPAEFDPDVHRNVLIWCLRFAVPFAAAELG